jgi:transposase
MAALVSSGTASAAPYFHPLLEQVKIPQAKGRPRTRPKEIVADKAYDSAQLRRRLRERGIRAMIPERQLPEGRKRRKRGPPYRFDKDTYKKRAAIDQIRSIGTVHRPYKECQRIAARYEKLAVRFLAMIKLAFVRYYLKKYSPDPA